MKIYVAAVGSFDTVDVSEMPRLNVGSTSVLPDSGGITGGADGFQWDIQSYELRDKGDDLYVSLSGVKSSGSGPWDPNHYPFMDYEIEAYLPPCTTKIKINGKPYELSPENNFRINDVTTLENGLIETIRLSRSGLSTDFYEHILEDDNDEFVELVISITVGEDAAASVSFPEYQVQLVDNGNASSAPSGRISSASPASLPDIYAEYSIPMGEWDEETSAGNVSLSLTDLSESTSSLLSSFNSLILRINDYSLVDQVLRGSGDLEGAIHQLLGPKGLYDIRDGWLGENGYDGTVIPQGAFEIIHYENWTGSSPYIPSGNASELFRIEQLGSESGADLGLKVTRTIAPGTPDEKTDWESYERITVSTLEDGTALLVPIKTGWKRTSQNGTRVKNLYWKETTESGAETPLYEYVEVYDHRVQTAPILVARTKIRKEKIDGKWRNTEFIEGAVGAERVTTWTYVADPNDPDYGKLRSVQYPDGSWSYNADFSGNNYPTTRYLPWKDVTLAQAIAANGVNCKVVITERDDPTDWSLIKRNITKIEDVVVSRTEERSGGVFRRYTDASNYLDTVTTGASYMPDSVTRPDGTKTTYVYDNGFWDGSAFSTADPGNAQPAFCKITKNGTQASPEGIGTEVSPEGIVGQSTWHCVITVNGETVSNETMVYDGTSNPPVIDRIIYSEAIDQPLADWRTETATDESGRVLSENIYDGEDLLRESIDASGINTAYTYDLYRRQATVTRSGLTTTYHYDTEGRVEGTTVTPEGFTTPALTTATTYHTTGEIDTQTDSNQLTSTYTYSNGGRTRTHTRPDTATEVTESYWDGQTKSVTGTGVIARYYSYSVEPDGNQVSREDIGIATSLRWSERETDWNGRTVEARKPAYSGANHVAASFYNSKGQLEKHTSTGLAPTLYTYNDLGQRLRQGRDLNANNALDEVSAEPITESIRDYVELSGEWYQRSLTRRWLDNDSATATDVQTSLNRLTGLSATTLSESTQTDVYGNDTVTTITVDRATATVTQTADLPDASRDAVSITVDGRVQSSTDPRIPSPEANITNYAYDTLGRLYTLTDPTTAVTTQTYYSGTNQLKTIEPTAGAITELAYRTQGQTGAGQVANRLTKSADGSNTLSQIDMSYDLHGRLTGESGIGTYPLTYGYDPVYGQRTTLSTYRDATADTTTWVYQASTGLLTRKEYADTKGTDYTYHDNGLLHTRTWARGIVTTYTYDSQGQPDLTDYSDTTTDIDWTYNRAGRMTNVVDAVGSHALDYADDGQLTAHTVSSGILNGLALGNTYPNYGKRDTLTLSLGVDDLISHQYGYDTDTGRLDTVTDQNPVGLTQRAKATYAYKASTHLTESITMANATVDILTRSMTYDALHRVDTLTASDTSANQLSLHDYTYDARSRRERVDREDSSYWVYSYNDRNEVESGIKYFSDGTAIPGYNYGFQYDNIGNRDSITLEGSSYDWSANALNQIVSYEIPDTVWISGTAHADAAIFLNDQITTRKGIHWAGSATVDNSTATVSLPLSIESLYAPNGPDGEVLQSTVSAGQALLPQTPLAPIYDFDGNLSQDGRWSYTWNGENRLITMETISAAYNAGVPREKLEFVYDYQGRRVSKSVSTWDQANGQFVVDLSTLYLYDAWNLIAEITTQGGSNTGKTYLWGTDLSGSLRGAGGVGGLLSIESDSGTYFPSYDGNGNISILVDASDGSLAAEYDYSPFGQTLKATGEGVAVNPFGFSTKYEDTETGLLYYGFRYYDAATGRWPNRDPLGEWGGLNLYRMIGNHLINSIDYLGWYELQYDMFDTFTSGERDKLTDSLDRVNKRIKDVLIPDLDAQIAEISGKDGCCWDKLKAELEELKSVFESVLNGINSSSENLEIERAKLKQGTDAQIDVNPVPFVDPVLQVDDKFFSQDMQSMDEDLMHELSHIYGTEDHDKEGDFMNAHRFDDFMRKKVSEGPMFKFRENNCKNEDLKK